MSEDKTEAKKDKKPAKKPVKKTGVKAILQDTCIVIFEEHDGDCGIDHEGRISIVVDDLCKSSPTTYALRTKDIEIEAKEAIFALGHDNRAGEIGLPYCNDAIEGIVVIAMLKDIKLLSVAGSENSLEIKSALRSMVKKKKLNILVN